MVSMDPKEILVDAIEMELEGKEFFGRVANQMTNQKTKDTFNGLVKQEERHVEILSAEFERLSQGKSWASLHELGGQKEKSGVSSVFKDRQIKRIKLSPSAGELEALKLGIEVEKKSIEYYTKAASMVDDPKAKEIFRWLVGEEGGHLTILSAEYDYRSKSGYYYDKAEFSLEVE
ncbi:MAG: hypothetical protein A3K76_06865 [Euryarchaeota archaeon RBG_13_57_23]|nr:MAG: hypothetical protein A3K76_06865 [Euryarchaeota archaeon RBG_13_57_23]